MGCGASAGPRGEGAQCGAKEEVFAISPSTRVFLENVSGYVASVLAALNIFFWRQVHSLSKRCERGCTTVSAAPLHGPVPVIQVGGPYGAAEHAR